MAFRRTFKMMAGVERADVSGHLKKLWGKHHKVDGQVSQHLSPFEQHIVSPMFKDMPLKIFNRIKAFALEAGPGLVTGYAIYSWCESEYKSIAYHHRV